MKAETIEGGARQYLAWRRAQGYAKATIRNDKVALGFLSRAVGDHLPLVDIDQEHILATLRLTERTRSASSINMIHSSLSAFLRWCRMQKHIAPDNDPMLGLRYRRVPKKERKMLDLHEFPAFLDAAEQPRDRMFAALGLYLFLRASEAVNLRIRDVNLQAGTIGVTIFKTNDYDVMPISKELDRELRTWLTIYQEECGPLKPDWHLTPAKVQTGFGKHGLNPPAPISRPHDVIKRMLENYGWADTHWQGMHCLRASGARAWFNELNEGSVDGSLRLVQTHLHHASVQMTERYLGLSADRARRDQLVHGESMFPSLDAENVVPLKKHNTG
jgi:integrase